ncbi:hypothetical protein KIF59_03550 [Enterobacter cloacae subsp. cloacae]|nr:hypothetical protein [Enterobacter cloacae subsp. cloacae]
MVTAGLALFGVKRGGDKACNGVSTPANPGLRGAGRLCCGALIVGAGEGWFVTEWRSTVASEAARMNGMKHAICCTATVPEKAGHSAKAGGAGGD